MTNEELIDQLAAQNAQLREALEFARSQTEWNLESEEGCDCAICEALDLPDHSSSILAKRDAEVLRTAASWFAKDSNPGRQNNGWCAVELRRMADELEAKAKETK